MGKIAVLLLGHGSRADGANDGMHRVAEALRKCGEYDIVEMGFMIRNFPSIEDGAAACVRRGADMVLMVPYFLHTGLHLIEDLPDAVPHLEKLHPGVRFVLGQPMGLHPKLVEIVEDRIRECRVAGEQGVTITGDAVLQRGMHVTHWRDSSVVHPPAVFATAAALAAVLALNGRRKQWQVEVPLADGKRARLPVKRCEVGPEGSRSAVVVDTGEDEDSEREVYAEAAWQDGAGLRVELGEGTSLLAAENALLIRGIEDAVSPAIGSILSERGIRLVISVPWVR